MDKETSAVSRIVGLVHTTPCATPHGAHPVAGPAAHAESGRDPQGALQYLIAVIVRTNHMPSGSPGTAENRGGAK
jgi:hypothetical protein